jgi:hypothetical protein
VPNLLYLFRYFRVVSPIPFLMVGSFGVATVVGAVVIVIGNRQDSAVAVPVIVLEAFSASTGFTAPARRGYFDLLLARGEPRARIATAQWLTAIAPGIGSWATLAVTAALAGSESANPMISSGTTTALLMVSTIPWAATVALPRFSGAIGWLLVVAIGATVGVTWPDPIRRVMFPIAMVGQSIDHRLDVLLPALLLSIVSVMGALLWVHRSDIPLEAAQ